MNRTAAAIKRAWLHPSSWLTGLVGLARLVGLAGRVPAGRKRSGGRIRVGPLQTLLYRLSFGTATRAQVWQLMADVLAGGSQTSRMLGALSESYSLQGRKHVARILDELRQAVGDGHFAQTVSKYAGMSETILFDGFGRQDAGEIFTSAARILRMELAIRRAFIQAIILPLLLGIGLLGLVVFFGLGLIPALGEVIDLDTMPPFQHTVISVVTGFVANPWVTAVVLAGGIGIIGLAMRYWTGPGRAWADRYPPFSLIRLRAGAGFLFAVTEYGRSGQAVTTDLLDRMAKASPPYAASRIRALERQWILSGGNLGDAALRAAQGFPAPELGAVIRVLWNEQDGIARCGDVLERWLVRVEDRTAAALALLNGVLLVLVAVTLLALMSIALPVIDQINATTTGVAW